MPDTPDGLVVRSRPTRAERVSKIDPVELFRSRDRVIVFMGTDVTHRAGPELTGKIVQRSAKDHTKPEISISLPAEALLRLSNALGSIPAVRAAGTVVVVPADGDVPIGRLREIVDKLVADPTLLKQLDGETLAKLDSGLHQMRRIATMKVALSELDELLERGVSGEDRYQDWCARNGWAFGVEYETPDAVRSIAAEDHVDILIPRLTGYRDVIELKRPDAQPLIEDRERGTWYWSSPAARAISQTLRYTEKLALAARHGLDDHPEILAYHPLGTIVMGRSETWTIEQRRWLVKLNATLHGVHIMTYDDLRRRAARMLELVSED